ncbi:MAG: hypothetical protein ACE5FB_08445, partial [Candidatus Binatia bacterium]
LITNSISVKEEKKMRSRLSFGTMVLAVAVAVLGSLLTSLVFASDPVNMCGFDGTVAKMAIKGNAAYHLGAEFAASGGSFTMTADGTGPLTGILAGEGVRWQAKEVLETFTLAETGDTFTTTPTSVVFRADFYREGDGDVASFRLVPGCR